MSLGWQCESALLPSKSKPINVDGKSMVGLKALLYNEEQQKSISVSSSRQQRRPKQRDTNSESLGKETPHKKEEPPRAEISNEKETQAYRALQAKAKLYEEMANGKSQLQSDIVDFARKSIELNQHLHAEVQAEANQAVIPPPPKPPSCRKPFAGQPTDKAPATTDKYYKAADAPSSDVTSEPQWNWSTTYATSKSSSTDAYQRNVGASAVNSDSTSTYASQGAAERELKRVIAERVQEEQKSTLSTVSEGARVKTQWEKTLNSSARSFLDEIHEDVAAQREVACLAQSTAGSSAESGTGTKRSSKEERLELIRQKRLRL